MACHVTRLDDVSALKTETARREALTEAMLVIALQLQDIHQYVHFFHFHSVGGVRRALALHLASCQCDEGRWGYGGPLRYAGGQPLHKAELTIPRRAGGRAQ